MAKNNAIFKISAYKDNDTWYFDDEKRGIFEEPFVLGASEMITKMVGSDKTTCTLAFSEQYIPNADNVLKCTELVYPVTSIEKEVDEKGKTSHKYIYDTKKEPTSGWYTDLDDHECWLCPAQLAFFDKVAETIYVKVL